jgi:hypothetical protein
LKDARTGLSPYFWSILTSREERGLRLREGLHATARVILLALAMDVAYQVMSFGVFYPVEAAVVVFVLAFAPYLLTRGPPRALHAAGSPSNRSRGQEQHEPGHC